MNTHTTMRKQQYTLWLIAAAFIVPLLGSYLLLHFKMIGQPTHNGTLLKNHEPWPTFAKNKTWQLLYIPKNQQCNQACWDDLDTLAKLKILLGKQQNKVKILYTSNGGNRPKANDYVHHTKVNEMPKITHAYSLSLQQPQWLLIDPMGRAVLSYQQDQVPQLMLKDLTKLLKASRKL